ncbi:HAD-IC family P-type ATPase [Mycoplasma sp. HU2014]|uniref:HAD-IC family P-type ATPase n=1 Tax=Mycoplasma sp. HU2014 TaxID=1664275 RepID=UPI00067D14FF|nr:HAD-IC family P-type ATPase [Mycoplasma sp. HU2014]KNG79434.1 magnesium-translocating P-type ATPase [Mycoplasma sp. HU2014]
MLKLNKKTNNQLKYKNEEYVKNISKAKLDKIEKILDSQIGLDDKQREENTSKFKSNYIVVKKFPVIKKMFESLVEPFSILLWIIGIIEFAIFAFVDKNAITLISAIMIIFMIFLASTVDFTQEYRAYQTNLELNKMIENHFLVLNKKITNIKELNFDNFKPHLIELEQSKLTIGDVVLLNQGDIVPSDCRIIWNDNLYVDQSTLTGENNPIKKSVDNKNKNLIELENILFKETTIVSGSCLAVVINVSGNNYSNSLLKSADEESVSDYEKSMSKVTKILVFFILTLVPIITLISLIRNDFSNYSSAIIFGLSIAVSLTPEALPAIISSNLKLGSKKLAKEKAVIKKLSVFQNMGSVNVVATDKTGTLTLENINLNDYKDLNNQSSELLKQYLYYNAYFQRNLFNNIDKAIVNANLNVDLTKIKLLDEQQFSHETRINSVLINDSKQNIQITKGSVEEMLEIISFVNDKKVIKINDEIKNKIMKQANTWSEKGYRVILIATKITDQIQSNDLVYQGMAMFEDVVKPEVEQAIETFKKYGVDIKVLTGDNKNTTKHIADKIGIKSSKLIAGEMLDKLNSSQIDELTRTVNIFYKLSPFEKAQIIHSLKKENVVAYLGDGVNDAIALKKADVGISVNNATPLAKSCADVILLEKDLNVLENVFVKGRQTFANAVKYIKITVASNFGIMLTLLISTMWLKFEAMSPIQLLIQNLIFDFANLIFVFDNVDQISIKKPKKWNIKTIIPFGIINGFVQTIISFINFFILYFAFDVKGQNMDAIHQFQTAYFLESILTHIVIILVYRTELISFIQSIPSKEMVIGMLFFACLPFMIIFADLNTGDLFNFNLGKSNFYWWFLILFVLEIFAWILAELFKFTYKNIFKSWL